MTNISDDDRKLWLSVVKGIKPLEKQHAISPTLPIRNKVAKKEIKAKIKPQKPIDKPIKSGTFKSDALIDLHEKSIHEAHQCVRDFLNYCWRAGKKHVIVITGHGSEFGSIKREFCFWLEEPAIKRYIQSYQEAHPRQGGRGAYYIIIKGKKRDE